jgi:hypothetical protein
MVPLETASSPSIHLPDDMLGLMAMSHGKHMVDHVESCKAKKPLSVDNKVNFVAG